MTTQLRLLSGGELPARVARARRNAARRTTEPVIRMDSRTRQIGRTGVAEARRRLAAISDGQQVGELVRAS